MYSLITKEEICQFISISADELEVLQKRIFILTKEAIRDPEAEVESILSASLPPTLNSQGSVSSGKKSDLEDVYQKAVSLLRRRSEEAFCELRALVEKQETIFRVLSAYRKLPETLHMVLKELYKTGAARRPETDNLNGIRRIEKATGWKRRHIFNLRNKALDLVLEIYQSHLTVKQIHRLDLTTYKGGPLENYIKTYR